MKHSGYYLEQYGSPGQILWYSPVTGEYRQLDLHDPAIPGKGFYHMLSEGPAGVFPSPTGPIFFYKSQRFPLTGGTVKADIIGQGETNEFRLEWEDGRSVAIRYVPPELKYIDNWTTTEEDIDFFRWLKASLETATFYEFLTER